MARSASKTENISDENEASYKKQSAKKGTKKTASDMPSRFRLYGYMPTWLDNSGPKSDVVLSTRIRLARNLADNTFPSRASPKEKTEIFDEVSATIQGMPKQYGTFEVINFSKLKKIEQHFLVEERMASIDMLRVDGERGIACDLSRKFSVMINEEDHLRIQGIDSGFRTFELWEAINKLDDGIGKRLKYAYSERLGFLTSCPTNSGTGMRISYLMHLPGLVLTRNIEPVLQAASQLGISTRGFLGEGTDVVGNMFQLSNQATMGACETEFIANTSKAVEEIIEHERKARKRIMKDAPLELSDKVYRSSAILLNARLMGLAEMLNLLSALRFGIESGAYKAHTIDEVNKATIVCMPAHLQIYMSDKKDMPEVLDAARAVVVKEILQENNVKKRAVKKRATVTKE